MSIYLEGSFENNVKEITTEVWYYCWESCKDQPVGLGPAGWSQQLPFCCRIAASQCHHLFPVCLHHQQLLLSRGFLKRRENSAKLAPVRWRHGKRCFHCWIVGYTKNPTAPGLGRDGEWEWETIAGFHVPCTAILLGSKEILPTGEH